MALDPLVRRGCCWIILRTMSLGSMALKQLVLRSWLWVWQFINDTVNSGNPWIMRHQVAEHKWEGSSWIEQFNVRTILSSKKKKKVNVLFVPFNQNIILPLLGLSHKWWNKEWNAWRYNTISKTVHQRGSWIRGLPGLVISQARGPCGPMLSSSPVFISNTSSCRMLEYAELSSLAFLQSSLWGCPGKGKCKSMNRLSANVNKRKPEFILCQLTSHTFMVFI